MTRRRALLTALAGGLSALAGCPTGRRLSTDGGDRPTRTATVPPGPGTVAPAVAGAAGYTHLRASGNRVLAGAGSAAVYQEPPAVYEPDGRPAWLVAVPGGEGATPAAGATSWLVASATGRVERFTVRGGTVVDGAAVGRLPAGSPPVVTADGDAGLLARPPDTAKLSHPVVLDEGVLFVDERGGLVARDGADRQRAAVDALPDARPVRVAPGRWVVLAGRTDRYAHGALGDATEAERVVLADVRDGLDAETLVSFETAVVEGTAPIAADLTGDGRRDVVLTLSEAGSGARLAAFDLDGERLATGPAFPTGNRWRHQLCVAPVGPGGRRELLAVETPHVGGTARFHRLRDGALRVVAAHGGVSSHALGSRILDGGLAGDIDGDGRVEALVPTQRRDELLGLRRTAGGVAVPWRLGLDGTLVTNLTGTSGPDGSLAVAAGDASGTVRVWNG